MIITMHVKMRMIVTMMTKIMAVMIVMNDDNDEL